MDEPGPSKSLLERLDTDKEETNPRSLISRLDNSSDKENKIPDLVSSTKSIRNVETLPKLLQNYKDQGLSIADNIEEQYRDPDEVSMGSDDKIYGDAPDNMDNLMDMIW